MNKIQELENQLHELHLLKNDKSKSGIFNLLDENIDKLQKELNIEKSKKIYTTKKDLKIKLAFLLETRKQKEQVADYNQLTKEIKEIRNKIKELEGCFKYLSIFIRQ